MKNYLGNSLAREKRFFLYKSWVSYWCNNFLNEEIKFQLFFIPQLKKKNNGQNCKIEEKVIS